MKIWKLSILFLLIFMSCNHDNLKPTNVIFLHHSTGGRIWKGNPNKYFYKVFKQGRVAKWIKLHNKTNKSKIRITELKFPKKDPYGWKNYPFDYYNIWVKHAGTAAYMEEPTLEMLTADYDIIIWKHCFPVSHILPDSATGNIDSETKTIANYKLQYNALKEKMRSFKGNKFIVWTPVPLVESKTSEDEAQRVREFYDWVINTWDEKNDNVFLWDYYKLATEDGLYLKPANAESADNSHPSKIFADKVSKYFANRIIQVANGTADESDITGKPANEL
jgi:hypothetical protein